MVVGDLGRGLCIDVSRVHDFHGNAANPSLNGTLRHADINHVLSHRAQEKIDKYRAGYAALDVRIAFLPAVVSTSGRIHGDLLRLLYLLADNKTKCHYRDRHEVIDDDSEAYCCTVGGGAASSGACGPPSAWPVLRRLPRPRRSLATVIRSPAPGAPVLEPLHLTPRLHQQQNC